MSSHVLLGDLSYVRIWHDNSGEGNDASWYLHKIVVTDLQTDQKYAILIARKKQDVLKYLSHQTCQNSHEITHNSVCVFIPANITS